MIEIINSLDPIQYEVTPRLNDEAKRIILFFESVNEYLTNVDALEQLDQHINEDTQAVLIMNGLKNSINGRKSTFLHEDIKDDLSSEQIEFLLGENYLQADFHPLQELFQEMRNYKSLLQFLSANVLSNGYVQGLLVAAKEFILDKPFKEEGKEDRDKILGFIAACLNTLPHVEALYKGESEVFDKMPKGPLNQKVKR